MSAIELPPGPWHIDYDRTIPWKSFPNLYDANSVYLGAFVEKDLAEKIAKLPEMVQLLKDSLYALNSIKNTKITGIQYKDSYELAAAISSLFRELKNI